MPREGLHAWPCRVWHATLSLSRKPRPARRGLCALLNADDHRVGTYQMFDASFLKSRLLHPPRTICAAVVESTGGFDQHIQAHHQSESVHRAIVVDDGLVNDVGAARRQGVISFADQ